MTREEVKQVVKVVDTAYPNWNPADMTETVDLWTAVFKNYPADIIKEATMKYITSNTGFAPAPGQIIGFIDTGENILNEEEAWDLVFKGICNSGRIEDAEKEYAKLPKACQKAIGTPYSMRELALMDKATVLSVEKSHFMRVYRVEIEKKLQYDRTSEGLLEIKEQETIKLTDKNRTEEKNDPSDGKKYATPEQVDEYMKQIRERLKGKWKR